MAGLRHDAKRCRENAKSLQVRLSIGHLYPEEIQAQQEVEERRRQVAQKKASKGTALPGLEEE